MLGIMKQQQWLATAIQELFGDWAPRYVYVNPNSIGTYSSDTFAQAFAVSGSKILVGAYQEDNPELSAGAAYIIDADSGALLHTLVNPDTADALRRRSFGSAVAISSQYAVVGAYDSQDAVGTFAGAAYIFDVSDGSLVHSFYNPNNYKVSTNDWFGAAVAITDDYVAISAIGEDNATTDAAHGIVYVYSTTDWSLVYTMTRIGIDTNPPQYFGRDLRFNSTHLFVVDNGGTSIGRLYAYRLSDGGLDYIIDDPNVYSTAANDFFGIGSNLTANLSTSLDVTDSYIIAGAQGEEDPDTGASNAGVAYVFDASDGSLIYTFTNPNWYSDDGGVSDAFGSSVAINDRYAIVGASGEETTDGSLPQKAVYIFDLEDGSLIQQLSTPNAVSATTGGSFGHKLLINDNDDLFINDYLESFYGSNGLGGNYYATQSGVLYRYTKVLADQKQIISVRNVITVQDTTTITLDGEVGSVMILFDSSDDTTEVVPTGFTLIDTVSTTGVRSTISYKIIGASDIGNTVSGMGGNNYKTVMTLVGTKPISLTPTVVGSVADNSTSVTHSLPLTGLDAPVLAFSFAVEATTLTVNDGTLTNFAMAQYSNPSALSVYTAVRYRSFFAGSDPTDIDVTLGSTAYSTNTLQSFYITIT
jgi:hypothetical protein